MTFPSPKDININMMPFIMGSEEATIPKEYHGYIDLIKSCWLPESERGKVGYLTIQESLVSAGTTQRRCGLHTDRHLNLDNEHLKRGLGLYKHGEYDITWHWGGREGGIYIASNVAQSTRVWNAFVEVPGPLGDCEHLREFLGEGESVDANELIWITDGTPHEALPADTDVYRQFFRLVTSDVDVWYDAHSTRNPLGTEPAARVVFEDKFSAKNYVLK